MQRQIVPSARADFERIGHDYGIAHDVDEWCHQIVVEANLADRPVTGMTEVPFDAVLTELEDFRATPGSEWARAWSEFSSAGWLKKVQALKVLLTKRTLPWKLRVNSREFQGLAGSVPVEVEVVYDINHVNGTVTFLRLESYTPVQQVGKATDDAVAW